MAVTEGDMPTTPIDPRRRAVILIDAQTLTDMFKEDGGLRCFVVTKGIPVDSIACGALYDPVYDRWELCIQSQRFDAVESSMPIPRIGPIEMESRIHEHR